MHGTWSEVDFQYDQILKTRASGNLAIAHSCGKLPFQVHFHSPVRSSHFWGPKAEGGGHCRDGTAALALEFGPENETRRDSRSQGRKGSGRYVGASNFGRKPRKLLIY